MSPVAFACWILLLVEFSHESPVLRNNDATCWDNDCKEAAIVISASMNVSVQPCDDFYEYVCGSWPNGHPVPEDDVELSPLILMARNLEDTLREIVEEDPREDDHQMLKLSKSWYRSCMDMHTREEVGINPLADIVNANGGWPILEEDEDWNPEAVTWQEIENYYSKNYGHTSFYDIAVIPNNLNSSVKIISLSPTRTFPFFNSFTKNDVNHGSIYINTLIEVALAFAEANGSRVSREKIEQEAKRIYEFQQSLKKALSREHLREEYKTISELTIQEFQEWHNSMYKEDDDNSTTPTPEDFNIFMGVVNGTTDEIVPNYTEQMTETQMDWWEIFESKFDEAGIELSENETIMVSDIMCFHKLALVLSETPAHVIVNYIHWGFVAKMMRFTNQKMMNLFAEAYNLEAIKHVPQWKTCLREMHVRHALSYQYVQRYFPNITLEAVNEMVNAVQKATEDSIHESGWMDDGTKELAIEKLKFMKKLIGYPDWYRNETAVQLYCNGTVIGPIYFHNIMKQRIRGYLKSLENLRSVKTDLWYDFPTTVNAFYVRKSNSIIIPAGIVQKPYFIATLPIAVNYGFLGFLVGHEMSHGFDNIGKYFDKYGNIVDWWSKDMFEAYEKKADCFVDQFNEYKVKIDTTPVKYKPINGDLTERENIADSAGVKSSLIAYRRKLREKGRKGQKLPGFESYTHDQLFFIAFASAWCGAAKPSYQEIALASDKHSPAKYRVIGSLANLPEFSQAFYCPPGSTMNPATKCDIWK